MALCNKCLNTDKEYEEFRAGYDDSDVGGTSKEKNHYCRMYNDTIPTSIYYDGEICPWYIKK